VARNLRAHTTPPDLSCFYVPGTGEIAIRSSRFISATRRMKWFKDCCIPCQGAVRGANLSYGHPTRAGEGGLCDRRGRPDCTDEGVRLGRFWILFRLVHAKIRRQGKSRRSTLWIVANNPFGCYPVSCWWEVAASNLACGGQRGLYGCCLVVRWLSIGRIAGELCSHPSEPLGRPAPGQVHEKLEFVAIGMLPPS